MSSVEFDKDAAEEYDHMDHVQVFGNAVAKLLSSWDWFTSAKELQILDFGCGTGRTSIEMAQRGHHVTGVDVSSHMLNQFRAKLESAPPAVKERIRLVHMTTEDGSDIAAQQEETLYDVVFVAYVLHHVPLEQQQKVIANLAELLKVGGRLVVLEIDDTERVRAAFAKFHDQKDDHHSKGNHASTAEHNHTHDWLDCNTVASWMVNAGLSTPVEQSFDIQHTDWTMDCYHVSGTKS